MIVFHCGECGFERVLDELDSDTYFIEIAFWEGEHSEGDHVIICPKCWKRHIVPRPIRFKR